MRELANRTFRHLHELSLRFHLERRTGGLNRVIERGVTGVDTIVRMAVLNSIPTAVELLMISGLVAYYFGWIYVVVVLADGRRSMSPSPSGRASGASPSAAT